MVGPVSPTNGDDAGGPDQRLDGRRSDELYNPYYQEFFRKEFGFRKPWTFRLSPGGTEWMSKEGGAYAKV